MSDWQPSQYLKFADERTRPARDLLAQVPVTDAKLIYDLGCGPGNSTELLVKAYPSAEIIGVDSSPKMLKQARANLPSLQFDEADLNAWAPDPKVDVLFSNATFQWLPEHLSVLQRLLKGLKPGGVLAVQMPDNLAEPTHLLMAEAARNTPYAEKLAGAAAARAVLPKPHFYYEVLKPYCARLDIWHTIYNHPLKGAGAVVEWVKGTGLRPFLAPLSEAEQADYLARYEALLAKAYPAMADGTVLLRFPRLFLVAVK
jgi:trans-aconitate 2-methyltransferase